MIDFAPHIDTLFEHLGTPAVYTPSGGSPVNVTVIVTQPDEVEGLSEAQFITDTTRCDLRKSEVAAPLAGDRVQWDGQTYTVLSDPVSRDTDRLIWTLSIQPV